MSIITNVFSALGNNSSLYPIIFKDSMDNTGRVLMAYNEGSKNGKKFGIYDARERFIEENATSLVWIGGIPALKLLYDRLVTNKIYKFSSIENLGSTFDKKGKRVLATTNLNLLDEKGTQTLKKNVDSIRESAKHNETLKKLVDQADKILSNPTKFKKVQAGRMIVSTLIPLVTVGFIIPKLIQKLTKKIYREDKKNTHQANLLYSKNHLSKAYPPVFSAFSNQQSGKNKQVNFGGKLESSIVNIFNNDVYNQVILDAGISGGRIITGVNTADKVEKGIKEAGVVFFIYLGGKIVANFFENIGRKIGMPISLDSQILEDKNFHKEIINISKAATDEEKTALKKSMFQFPECQEGSFKSLFKIESEKPEFKKMNIMKKIKTVKAKLLDINTANEKTIIDFVDKNITGGVEDNTFKNVTLKTAQKLGIVDLVEGVKNPLQYVDTAKIKGLNSSLSEFVEKALSKGSPEEVEKFLKKALNTKRGSIALNLAVCSLSTAYFLPKLQYLFREKFTKSSNLPSLALYEKQIEGEKLKAKS